MSEKSTQIKLSKYLSKFDERNIYYSPNEHKELKEIFKKASKKGKLNGIPDAIYYDKETKTIIIFECKPHNLNHAKNDLKIYKSKMDTNYKTYFVAFTNNCYEIYNNKFEVQNFTLIPKNFNIIVNNTYKIDEMEKDIHNVHNYIRNNTKISNEDKSFFIACILISFKKLNIFANIEVLESKKFIYDIIKENLIDFGIDITIFEFLRNDSNNIHFLTDTKNTQKSQNVIK